MQKPTVIFTFDDGFLDGYVWQRVHGLIATFFVNSKKVVDGMDHWHLGYLLDRKCEIGCHSYSHLLFRDVSEEVARENIENWLKTYDGICQETVSFAYPCQADGHEEMVHKFFPYIRPNIGFENPKQYGENTWLYLWHRMTETGTGDSRLCLNCETLRLKAEGARFITHRTAWEEGLLK